MNMLVDGEWRTDAYQTTNDDGEFDRQETSFRDEIVSDADAEFPAESGRYHVYISRACPWAHRVAMTRRLCGLEDDISLSVVEPERYEDGWEFSTDQTRCTMRNISGTSTLVQTPNSPAVSPSLCCGMSKQKQS